MRRVNEAIREVLSEAIAAGLKDPRIGFVTVVSVDTAPDLRSARAYAFRTATNVGIELIRTRKRQERHREAIATHYGEIVSDGDESGDEAGRLRICDERLRQALGALPAHLRSVVVLRDLACLSYEEISGMLQIGAATARVYRRHAIVRLAELLHGE